MLKVKRKTGKRFFGYTKYNVHWMNFDTLRNKQEKQLSA